MGKSKKQKPPQHPTVRSAFSRVPASPGQIGEMASRISSALLDFTDDESDRVLAIVHAANGDSEALSFYAERIRCRENDDEISKLMRDPDADSVEVEGDAQGNITRVVRRRG